MRETLKRKILLAPDSPGVYVFKNEGGPIYIGKAKKLSARLRSYLSPSTEKIVHMLEEARDLELIVVESEKEALLLEANLIREYKPKYNVRLKDTEYYPYIRISNDEIPYVEVVKRKREDGTYFGPYTSVQFTKALLETLQMIYGFRTCRRDLKKVKKPCFLYHLHRCVGPCVGRTEEHKKAVENLKNFLKGHIGEVMEFLRKKMELHSTMLDFENAAKYRDLLFNLSHLLESQDVVLPEPLNADILVHDRDLFVLLRVRDGYLIGKIVLEMEGGDVEDFIREYYLVSGNDLPTVLLLQERTETDYTVLGLEYVGPPRNELEGSLLEKAKRNLENEINIRGLKKNALSEMVNLLGLTTYPYRIEGIDVSHAQGKYTVASLVVFEDGYPKKNDYRRYRLDLERPDDYAAIREVIKRRYSKHPLPNLIFVDGGRGQVNAVLEALEELKLSCDVVGLAKSDETVVTPSLELRLPRDHPVLKVLIQVRDEAHRFALKYHRLKREKQILESILNEIPGVGPVRKKRLVEHFGSIENIKKSSLDELAKIVGSVKVAKEILERL